MDRYGELYRGPGRPCHTCAGRAAIQDSAGRADGTYTLQTINASGQQWASEWQGVKLTYRAGTQMTSVPADFECVAGSEAASASSSPFLAMSGYVQTAEPQYAQEHWYGLAKIHGQLEHVLIFPRAVKGDNVGDHRAAVGELPAAMSVSMTTA